MTLLAITFLIAVAFALSNFDSLLIPIAFPPLLGPIAAYRVTPSRVALAIGVLSSAFWTVVAIVPFAIICYLLLPAMGITDGRGPSRVVFVTSAIVYFLLVSLVGGYIGGVVAKND